MDESKKNITGLDVTHFEDSDGAPVAGCGRSYLWSIPKITQMYVQAAE